MQALGDQVAEKLRTKVGGQIELINLIVPLVNDDQDTQDRINALNVEKASTRVAEQRAKTAKAEARADEILSASVSNDPDVLVSKCLDTARGAHRPAGLLAEHRCGARRACAVDGSAIRLCAGRFLRHDSPVLRVTRSVGGAVTALIAALAIGLASSISSAAPAAATTPSAMTDAYTPPPTPLSVIMTPLTVGVHLIEALAEGIANAVEFIATPAPIAIPAPRTST